MSELLRSPDLTIEKGVDFSVPSIYLGQGQNYPQNLQLYRGEMTKRAGRSVVSTVSLGAQKILHLGVFEITSGTQRLIRHTKQNVQRYLAATKAWEDITGADLTGGETDFFDHTVVSEFDMYLFTNFIDRIRKYTDESTTQDLGGLPPFAKTIEYVSPYVLIGNIVSGGQAFPQKIQWSDTGQPEVWSGGNSGSQILADEPSAIRKIKKLLDYAFVYKEKSVYRGRKVSSSSIFDFGGGPFVSGKGIASPRAVADDGQNHYYMGLSDFHINNSVRIIDIGKPVREYIFNRLNRARINTCHALHIELNKEVWFFITIGGFDWPTEVWKYNYERDFWYFDTVVNCLAAANYKQTVDLTWDTDPGNWEDEITFWDDQQGLLDAPFPVFGYTDGFCDRLNSNVVDDRGVAVDARLDTKDYTGLVHKGLEYDTRWMQFDVWARGGGNLKLWYSTDYGSNWVSVGSKEITPSTEKYNFYFDVIAPHIRFRLQIDGRGHFGTIRSFSPYFLDQPEILQ